MKSMQQADKKNRDEKTTACGNVVAKHGLAAIENIIQYLQQINYGEVLITIHDGRIVQIEKREKTRISEYKKGAE